MTASDDSLASPRGNAGLNGNRQSGKPSFLLAPGTRTHVNVWIENETGELLFGHGLQQILTAIDARGSLSAAAGELGMSYRGLWARVHNSEKRLGFALVEAHAGRGPRSGSALTPAGRDLLQRFDRLRERVNRSAEGALREYFGQDPSCE